MNNMLFTFQQQRKMLTSREIMEISVYCDSL